ncbi:prolyl aminopeptidase (secreted protein) [Purpureocillium lavendulum]|uniref:Prolyl aminopeptidase (Secreted protein) n=1 Tax=Purpureocillium lavendulum TaxID=1247861 RepID=A0AB34FX67_9HYPO|nr:prolyl aminopeptidase (secreted protein) [Purpureocillium lavendulum]
MAMGGIGRNADWAKFESRTFVAPAIPKVQKPHLHIMYMHQVAVMNQACSYATQDSSSIYTLRLIPYWDGRKSMTCILSTMHPFLVLLGLLSLATAKQASDFNITTDEAHLALVGRDFNFNFYDTAAKFSSSRAGDLLKLEPVDPSSLDVKPGTTIYRIQYTSIDFDGSLAPVTGFIAFPYAAPVVYAAQARNDSSQGNRTSLFRLAAWAHGASGLYRGCAPSNGPTLHDPSSWQSLVDYGYAVVGTDYAGLGNNYTTHKFLSFNVHATDVYYSTVAARKAFPATFTTEWVSVGHSQGGGAVWKLAETDYVQNMGLADSYPAPAFLPAIAMSVRRATPSYNGTILTDQMQCRMGLADRAQMCFGGMVGMAANLSRDEIVSRDRLSRDMPVYLSWQARTAPALGDRSSAPILVIQGDNDMIVVPSNTNKAVEQACEAGNEVHYSVYPGIQHSSAASASLFEWIRWIDNRFHEVQGQKRLSSGGRCTKTVVNALDLANAKSPEELRSFISNVELHYLAACAHYAGVVILDRPFSLIDVRIM